jgi:hypothetical protein
VYLSSFPSDSVDDLVEFIQNKYSVVESFVNAVKGLKVGTENEQEPPKNEDKKGTT